jgi:ABC-type glutathione transport system ATPase component
LKDVSVAFTSGHGRRRRVLKAMDRVNLAIHAGETLGLVGESGSGKTTTAQVALGLRRWDSGTVTFAGEPLTRRLRDRAGRVAAVFQHPLWSLDPKHSALEAVCEPLHVTARGLPAATRRERAAAMLRDVGLGEDYAQRRPHELSGGQRQRVSIARALVTNPEFIVFDEAVSALDVSVQAQILALLTALQSQHSFAALFISHDLAAVRYVSHHVAVMVQGRIVEQSDTQTFYAGAAHPYSKQLIEELNR